MAQKKSALFNSKFKELNEFFASSIIVNHRCGSKTAMQEPANACGIQEFRKLLKKYEPAIPRCGFIHPTQMPPKRSRAD